MAIRKLFEKACRLHIFYITFFVAISQVVASEGFVKDLFVSNIHSTLNLPAILIIAVVLWPITKLSVEIQTLAFFGLVPCATNYLIAQNSAALEAFIISLCYFLVFLTAYKVAAFIPYLRLHPPILTSRTAKLVTLLSIVVFLCLYASQASFNFDLFAFYDSRFEARDASSLVKYSAVSIGSFGIAITLSAKGINNLTKVNIALFLASILFLTLGVRNTYFIIAIYILFCATHGSKYFIHYIMGFYVFLSSLVFLFPTTLTGLISSMLIRRTIIVPGYWPEKAIELANNGLLSPNQPLSLQAGTYFLAQGHNANMNPFITVHMEHTPLVSVLLTTILGLMFGYIVKMNEPLKGSVSIGFTLAIIYSSLRFQSWILSGGLLISLIYVVLAYRRVPSQNLLSSSNPNPINARKD